MPARITVYCRRPLTAPDWLAEHSRYPDYLTAAEGAGLDEADAEAAIDALHVAGHEITYGGSSRPIQVARYTDAAMVRTLVDEARERLEDDDPRGITDLLAATLEVIDFELGFRQAEGIGGVIAEQIARMIAISTDGIADFYGAEWRVAEDGRER